MPVVCGECGKPSFLDRKRRVARIFAELIQVSLLFGVPIFLFVNGYGLNTIIVFLILSVLVNIAYSLYWRYRATLVESCEFNTTWARLSNVIFFSLVGLLVLFTIVKNTN